MSLRVECLSIDAHDPQTLARWWAELLGWRIIEEDEEDDDEVVVVGPDDAITAGLRELLFIKVPEAKSVKNRLHLDLRPDNRDAEVARAEALGATRVDVGQGEQTWVVLADPEGNEFCILRARPPDEPATP